MVGLGHKMQLDRVQDDKTFLQRDAMHKHGLCLHAVSVYPSVRLSVCVSVTFVNCVKTNKHIIKNFSPSGTAIILVFQRQMA